MSDAAEPVTGIEVPINLQFRFTAGKALTRFLTQIREGRLVGQRCPSCNNVYLPPGGMCARCGVETREEVEVSDEGIIESFTIVHIPIPGNAIKPPFVAANIRLDGTDMACLHRVSEVDNAKVRVGMRVKAVWKPRDEWDYTFENIAWFKPVEGEDA
ncbi:MAG: Zn-ribbon domain-containing OB-fold protein [Gammaproteobacteria bacterium]